MNIEENYRESAQQQLKGNNRTRRIKVKLCFLSELLCLLFKLKLIFKPAILPNSFIFNCAFRTNRFLVVLGLPHILTWSSRAQSAQRTHPRKFGNHVTVHRASDRRSAPQAYQCKIVQSTGMAAQMRLKVLFRRKTTT